MNVFKVVLVSLIVLFAQQSFALGLKGTEGGNGGDLCESRIYDIRDDISTWISKGGPKGLEFPVGVDLDLYTRKMNTAIADAKISCTDEILKIGSAEKTCVNDENTGVPRIRCNIGRLEREPAGDRYLLIHHEFAGVAGLEVNEGEPSTYPISKQLRGFLIQEVVTKLAIKPVRGNPPTPDALLQDGFLNSFLETLSTDVLPMVCDLGPVTKSLSVENGANYSYRYVGNSCIRNDGVPPRPHRPVEFRLGSNYRVSAGGAVVPRSLVGFTAKVTYPHDVRIRQGQIEALAWKIWQEVRDDLKPSVDVKTQPDGGFILSLKSASGSVGFDLILDLQYVSVDLPTDPKRPVLTVNYSIHL